MLNFNTWMNFLKLSVCSLDPPESRIPELPLAIQYIH